MLVNDITNTLIYKINVLACTMYVPPKRSKRNKISRFHHEKKIIMRKRLKFVKSSKSAPSIKAQLVKFEKQICDSHLSDKL